MRRVAVFGNAGGGKSTVARQMATLTGLPLYTLDIIQYPGGRYRAGAPDGGKISQDEFLELHREIVGREQWIIDGYGSVASAWERFAAADTLVYIDLPLMTHYAGVTKRLVNGLFSNPEGWPENSPVWHSSLDAYRVVWLCHRHLTLRYRQPVAEEGANKRVHHLTSRAEVRELLGSLELKTR